MSSLFPRGSKLYAKIKNVAGEWKQVPTDFLVGQEVEARRWLAGMERMVEIERGGGDVSPMTVRRWVDAWSDEQRARGVVDWKRNKAWLVDLVVPELGELLVRDVRTPHVVELFRKIRMTPSKATGKPRAPRTLHNIHGALHTMLRDAVLAGHLEHAPESLDERQLGRKVDADPEWRESAQFTRDEVQTLISSPKIPWDRRIAYAVELLAGTRPGEAAALRWRHYDASKQPLGRLCVARAYSARAGHEKGTKTGAVKIVPVHPTLAVILAEWKLTGWAEMMGREPTAEDLIVPLPPADAAARTHKSGEAFRPDYYARRRWVEEDLPALGWRHRRHYDTRATFITLAVDDGASAAVIRDRVTHTKPRRDGFDFYDRGDHWIETCREVAKLKISRVRDPHDNVIAMPMRAVAGDDRPRLSDEETAALGAVVVQSAKSSAMSASSGLRRRVSKAESTPGGDRQEQSIREVERLALPPSVTDYANAAPRLVQAHARDSVEAELEAALSIWRERHDERELRRALLRVAADLG